MLLFGFSDRCIGRENIVSGGADRVFVFEPQERPVSLQLRKVRFLDEYAREHSARHEAVIGS